MATADVWVGLERRPLHLPALSADGACPVTSWQPASSLVPGNFGPGYLAFGPGPIYPIIYAFLPNERAVPFAKLPTFAEGTKQDKVLWIAAPAYRQPALVRGRQLDTAATVQIASAGNAPVEPELRIPVYTGASSGDAALGWRDQPSFFLVPGPGCYAFQVDGLSFSDVIVVQVSN